VSACVKGTDCTDCGGVDAVIDDADQLGEDPGTETCTNTCPYARDGVCDDPRGANYCKLGTDCQVLKYLIFILEFHNNLKHRIVVLLEVIILQKLMTMDGGMMMMITGLSTMETF
jgi:hypothetical protein